MTAVEHQVQRLTQERDEARLMVLRLYYAIWMREGWEAIGESIDEVQERAHDELANWEMDPRGNRENKANVRALLAAFRRRTEPKP